MQIRLHVTVEEWRAHVYRQDCRKLCQKHATVDRTYCTCRPRQTRATRRFFLKELIDESQTRSIKDDGITPRCDFKQPLKQLVIDEAFWKSLEAYRTSEVARGDIIKPLPLCGRKTRPPPFPCNAMATINGSVLCPEHLTSYTIGAQRCEDFMTSMLHTAQKVGTVHNIDIVGAGSRHPFGVDIGFIDPDRSNGAALAISEWDRSYSKDAEKLATGKMAGSQSRIMTQGMMVAEIKRLHRQGLSSLCSHTAIEIKKLDNKALARDLATARQQIEDLYRDNHIKYPPTDRPQSGAVAAFTTRSLLPGAPTLKGHLPGNVNPDHLSIFFRNAER